MKTSHYIKAIFIIFIAICISSCKRDENPPLTGITNQSWQEGTPLEIISGKELSVNFSAENEWTAQADAEWCLLLDESGMAGQNTLRIFVTTTTTEKRTANIKIQVKGYSAANLQVVQNNGAGSNSEDMEVNIKVDKYLREAYLWNEEYNTLTLDYTKRYDKFFYDALGSLKTNTLDKKYYSATEYTLYSTIEKKNKINSSKSTNLVQKELEYNYGITGLFVIYLTDDTFGFIVQGIYPGSSAEVAGLKRGSVITKINNGNITDNNLNDHYFGLIMPSSSNTLQITDKDDNHISISSTPTYVNPIILKQVSELYGHRIGYLVYDKFNGAFDDELFEVFKYFKSQNITDLILDLRYNMGGHTMSANLIASCVVGHSSTSKVFSSLRYNASRMQAMNNKREDEMFMYNNYPNLGISLSAGDLGLNHVYCLVGNSTASSSELVINSLRGIDVQVTLIGEKTVGKNVGMEPILIDVADNSYFVLPITFQSYNAKGFGDYESGFAPDIKIDETNPFNQEGVFYLPRPYGTDREYLYAEAVKMITGVDITPKTRSAQNQIQAKEKIMNKPVKVGFDAMLALPTE